MSKFTDSWTDEVNGVLNRIRLNSIELSERHRVNSFTSKSYRKYFDIPTIILSTMASSFAIGATKFVSQHVVSLTNCGINMFIAMLTSIKLYLNLDETFKNEQAASRAFEYLALDLSKMLRLRKEQRNCDGLEYLNKIYAEYIKLKGNSKLLSKMLKKDFMLDIDRKLLRDDDASYSGNYTPEFITLDDVKEQNIERTQCVEKKNSIFGNIFSSPTPYVGSSVKKQVWTPKRQPITPPYSREKIEKELQNELVHDLGLDNIHHYHDYGDIEMPSITHNRSPSLYMNYHESEKDNQYEHNNDTNNSSDIESVVSVYVDKPKQNKLIKEIKNDDDDEDTIESNDEQNIIANANKDKNDDGNYKECEEDDDGKDEEGGDDDENKDKDENEEKMKKEYNDEGEKINSDTNKDNQNIHEKSQQNVQNNVTISKKNKRNNKKK